MILVVLFEVNLPGRKVNGLPIERADGLVLFLPREDLARLTFFVSLAEILAVGLKGVLVDIPNSNGGVLARLPILPAALIFEHCLPSAIGNGPLLGAFESALGIFQARTAFVDVRGALLAATGPSPSGLPVPAEVDVNVPLLVMVSFDVLDFVFVLVMALVLGITGTDGTRKNGGDEHGEGNQGTK